MKKLRENRMSQQLSQKFSTFEHNKSTKTITLRKYNYPSPNLDKFKSNETNLMKGKAESAHRVPEGNLSAALFKALARPFCPAGVIRG